MQSITGAVATMSRPYNMDDYSNADAVVQKLTIISAEMTLPSPTGWGDVPEGWK